MNKKVLIIIAVVILLGGGAAAYFLLFAGEKEPAPEPRSAYVPGDYFVTNVADTNNLVKLTVVLEVNKAADDEEFKTFLTANNHIIRDTIVMIVRSKTYEELTSQDIKTLLSDEIIRGVNQNLGIDNVIAIYFNDYVVQ